MKALLQRVSSASVCVDGEQIAAISQGLLVFLGVEKGDIEADATDLTHRILKYRVFSDEQGRMNRSVQDISGDILLVSQFTLAADTAKGLRPGFSSAAPPDHAEKLYEVSLAAFAASGLKTESGRFGANMAVSLTNDGPVTFLLA